MIRQPTQNLLERLGLLLRTDLRQRAQALNLKPAQAEALIYLARCNRYSDTPQAVADYLALTKGTVSQSLLALERKGLIRRQPDADDGRVVRLRLTAKGRRQVTTLNRSPLGQSLDECSAADGVLQAQLEELLRSLQRANGMRTFGICATCRHHRREASGSRCGLTGEALTVKDAGLICREHEQRAA